jgi:hypothetical protein
MSVENTSTDAYSTLAEVRIACESELLGTALGTSFGVTRSSGASRYVGSW